MALLERASRAINALPAEDMADHAQLRALLWETYLRDIPALLLTLPGGDPPRPLLGRLVQRVVEGAGALPFLPPGLDPPSQDCWAWFRDLVAVVARDPSLTTDPGNTTSRVARAPWPVSPEPYIPRVSCQPWRTGCMM